MEQEDNLKWKYSFRSFKWPIKWRENELETSFLQHSLVQAEKIAILRQNSRSFSAAVICSPLFSWVFSPSWNYGNCLFFFSKFSFSSSTAPCLSLDLNLSPNHSHSQATQPFCIPISPCVCVRIKKPAECQWEAWLLFQLCVVHFRGWKVIYLHIKVKLSSTVFGAFDVDTV